VYGPTSDTDIQSDIIAVDHFSLAYKDVIRFKHASD
jgi:hypothetical protein